MLIHNKDDIQFVNEFPCFLGNPVVEKDCIVLEKDCIVVEKDRIVC